MNDKGIIKAPTCCNSGIGKIIGVLFIPVQKEAAQLDPITEDAEFEVIQPKMLEQSKQIDK